jgi:hypothetical protein
VYRSGGMFCASMYAEELQGGCGDVAGAFVHVSCCCC